MQRPSGHAAVRLSLWMLIAASFAMALVQPVQAGTEAAPELQDPQGDFTIFGEVPACAPEAGCPTGNALDLLTGWIDNESATGFTINLRLGGAPGGAQVTPPAGGGVPYGFDNYNAHFAIAGTEYDATVSVSPGPVILPSGVAASAAINDTLLSINVLKSSVGNPAVGGALTGFTVTTARNFAPGDPVPATAFITDDGAATSDYTFTGGGGPVPDPDDLDGDGLNNTCEQQYFGSTNSTANSTEDADGDGLTNGQECALGTDPTKADTDGDGTSDKDDPFPTDPTKGGSNQSSSSSTSTSRSSTTTTSRSSSTTVGSGGGGDDGDVESLGDAIDRLESDPGYLGLSGGGFLAVLVLSIVALAVRWSL